MTNDKLPEEISKKIDSDANDYLGLNEVEFSQRSFNSYIAGATAWAPWKAKHDELRKVLQEFVSNHEAGLLPNRFVYEKAIKILNDGNTERNAG